MPSPSIAFRHAHLSPSVSRHEHTHALAHTHTHTHTHRLTYPQRLVIVPYSLGSNHQRFAFSKMDERTRRFLEDNGWTFLLPQFLWHEIDWVALRELTQSCPQYLLELHGMSPGLAKLLVIAFSLDEASRGGGG